MQVWRNIELSRVQVQVSLQKAIASNYFAEQLFDLSGSRTLDDGLRSSTAVFSPNQGQERPGLNKRPLGEDKKAANLGE